MRTRLIVTFALLALPFLVPTRASAASLSASGRGHGVRLTLSVPKATYKRDWWIDAVVLVTNISHGVILLSGYPQTCDSSGYNGSNPIVFERNARGYVVYPPKARHIVPCRPPIPFAIKPGQTVRQLLYIPARGPYLNANVEIVGHGKRGQRTIVKVKTARIHIHIR